LAIGSTAVNVVVTAQDGTTTKTYTVTVIRAGSSNAALSALAPSAGTLSPAFSASTFAYSVAVDNAVDSISLTPTVADTTATVTVNGTTVASGSASAAISLAVGTTQISVVVTAQDGTTKQTYQVSVTRKSSAIADLSGLVPSAGSLAPAFSASTYSYSVTVANNVETISFTPTALDAAATISVNGSPVASGAASGAISLGVGTTNVSILVTAQDGTTTKTYSVSVIRSKPLPTAASRTIEVVAGSSTTVDLTEGSTGSPFTAAALTTVPGSNAGTTHLNAQTQQLTFDSSPTFSGSAGVGYTLTNASGTSTPATITFSVIARPDPSKDPEVIGLLRAQTDAAKRFAQYQTRNFNNRLEQLHDEGDRRRNSMDIRLGYRESNSNDQERRDAERHLDQMGDDGIPGLFGYADGTGASHSSGNPPSTSGIQGPDFGPYAVWTGGFIDFAQRDKGGLDIDSTAVGLSAGVDYRFSPKFVAGFGIGYGHDKSDVGDNGTESRANAYSMAVYGSYKAADHFFIDGLIGGSWLNFDSRRYVTANGDFADGQRDGRQIFGSLTAAYEFRDQKWLVSPYGRFEMSRSWLDGFTEKGGGIYGLTYGDQTVDTFSGVLGIRASYDFQMDWGTLTPGLRAEFTHDFAGSSRINLGYTDLGSMPYAVDIDSVGSDYATLGLSLDATFLNDWALGLEYRTAFGNGRQDQAVGLKIGVKF
jgi:outer membrane autotransporter protein